jgi:hypothetical protein
MSVEKSASQPSAGLLLQSPWPEMHVTEQTPLVHIAVEYGPLGHTWKHAQQLSVSVWVLASQPSDAMLLQSVKPVWQPAMVHAPFMQPPVVTWAPVQTLLHTPQLFGSVDGFTSQPTVGSLEQCKNPGAHVL